MSEDWKVVPAQPGWRLAELIYADDATPICFHYSEIIAWVIGGSMDELGEITLSSTPITVDGSPWGKRFMVRSPTKFHEIIDGGTFDSEEDALEWAIKEWGK